MNPLPFAWFSSFVAVNAVVFGIVEGVTGSEALGIAPDWRWPQSGGCGQSCGEPLFVTDIMGKKLGRFVPLPAGVLKGLSQPGFLVCCCCLAFGKMGGNHNVVRRSFRNTFG